MREQAKITRSATTFNPITASEATDARGFSEPEQASAASQGHAFAAMPVFSPVPVESPPVQMQAIEEQSTINLPSGLGGNRLPETVRAKMESSFGHDFSDVRVHQGDAASQIGAHAYTQGSSIHFAPGQYNPTSTSGQELLGHELAHVVQQREGRVKPTIESNGVAINDDHSLENEADNLGARAARNAMPQNEPLLSTQYLGNAIPDAPVQMKNPFKKFFGRGRNRNDENDSNSNDVPQQQVPQQNQVPAPNPLLNHWSDGKVGPFNDANLNRNKSKDNAAGGAINSVDKLTYNDVKIGSSNTGFFKEDKQTGDAGDAASGIGLKDGDLRLANRAVATSRLADSLGTDVVAKTEFATHNGKQGSVSEAASGRPLFYKEDAEVHPEMARNIQEMPEHFLGDENGMVTDVDGDFKEVKKRAGYYEKGGQYYERDATTKANHFDFSDAKIQKGMNDLQWHDALTGQVDRHGANIFIDDKSGKVTGIDNDAAFGSQQSDSPQDLVENGFQGIRGSHALGLPSLIDAETAAQYKTMTPDTLREQLGDLLSEAEIAASIKRLESIQSHIQMLEKEGKVVGGKPDPMRQAMEGYNNSYYGQKDEQGGYQETDPALHGLMQSYNNREEKENPYASWGQGTYDLESKNEKGSYLGRSVQFYEQMKKQGNAESAEERGGDLAMEQMMKSFSESYYGQRDEDGGYREVDPTMHNFVQSYNNREVEQKQQKWVNGKKRS